MRSQVRVDASQRPRFAGWFGDLIAGRPSLRDVTVNHLNTVTGNVARTFVSSAAFPVRYVLPTLSATAATAAVVERVKLLPDALAVQ